jgi:hypothetical protein
MTVLFRPIATGRMGSGEGAIARILAPDNSRILTCAYARECAALSTANLGNRSGAGKSCP